jgi:hypothetical protein
MKYKVEVVRTDSFTVDVDKENESLLELVDNYSEYISPVDDMEEFIENLCRSIVHNGVGEFYEGFGFVRTISGDYEHWKPEEEEFAPGITVYLEEQGEYDCEITEQ